MSVAARLTGVAFADDFRVPFQEAIDYLRQKVNLPTRTWRDLQGRAHDRAFVVAGATKEALLTDLRQAVDDALAGGMRLEVFQKRFEEIVAKNGWTGWTGEKSAAGRAWRARIIYETNLRTAYAAGRYRQMTHPDMVKVRPYWQYRHGDTRTPKTPRPQHVAWDGIILRWDDPVWRKIYPPNGWLCSCGVRPLSRRELARLGKTGPDTTPELPTRPVRDPVTGDEHQVPEGIDFGWDHAPGQDWAQGLVPPPLQEPLPPSTMIGPRRPAATPPLRQVAQPIEAPVLPADKPTEWYVDRFLGEFGAARGGGAQLVRDAAGHAVTISEDLFRAGSGGWKMQKHARAIHALRLAEALRDPDEIWVDWAYDVGRKAIRLVRRYLRLDPAGGGFAVFEWSTRGWSGVTSYPPKLDMSAKAQETYLEQRRTGALLYRRDRGNS